MHKPIDPIAFRYPDAKCPNCGDGYPIKYDDIEVCNGKNCRQNDYCKATEEFIEANAFCGNKCIHPVHFISGRGMFQQRFRCPKCKHIWTELGRVP